MSIALLCAGELDGRQLIEPGLIEAMLEPQNAEVALDLGLSIGLGLFLEQATIPGATRVARHSGHSLGYTAEWILLPEQGLGVAVLANAGHTDRIVKRAEAILANAMKLEPAPMPGTCLWQRMKTPAARATRPRPRGISRPTSV